MGLTEVVIRAEFPGGNANLFFRSFSEDDGKPVMAGEKEEARVFNLSDRKDSNKFINALESCLNNPDLKDCEIITERK